MIRATTGGVMKTYRSNLMNSFINMNSNRNTVLSQRIFNSYAEDPAAAAKAFRLRKSRMTVSSQHDICVDTMKKYESAFSCLQSVDDVLCTKEGVYGEYMKTLTGTTLKMLNDPTGDAREQLNKVLDQMSQSIIQTMNQKYGDNFIFAGADGHNVPFEIRDNVLYYRGVRVDAAVPNVWKDEDGFIAVDKDGKLLNPAALPDDDEVFYVRTDNATILSHDEYLDLYTKPEQQTFGDLVFETNDDGTLKMYAYDSDGCNGCGFEVTKSAEGIYTYVDNQGQTVEVAESDVYYNAGTANIPKRISIETYEYYKDNTAEPIEYNENGMIKNISDPDQAGGYYMCETGSGATKLMSEQEYNETVERSKNPAKPLSDENGYVDVDKDGNPVENGDEGGYYRIIDESQIISKKDYEAAVLEVEKLEYLANEKYFVDIGLGFQEDDKGKLIESSGFNASITGLTFIGYGLDEDGDPKNLYSLVQEMRKIANSVPSGTDWDTETWNAFDRLVDKFEDGVSNYQTEFTNLAAGTTKLENQEKLLLDNFYNLQEQYSDLEDVDMVDAITSFIWAEYCYNAALKVGNSILSESLMDYLR